MDEKPDGAPAGIETDLDMIHGELRALGELPSNPQESGDGWRVYDFGVRWGTLMSGRLLRVEHYHRTGELTRDQERRYQELKRRLEEAMPAIRRLDLAKPRISFDDTRPARGS